MYPNAEEVGLKISLGGGLLFALIGISMALWSKSQLVLLDGSYSLIDSFFTFLMLKVTLIIGEDRSKKIKVEYWKDIFLILRSLLIIAFLLFLFKENLYSILNGGRVIDTKSVGLYTFISIVGGIFFVYYLSYWSKKSNSRVLRLEKKSWLIDTLLSTSIALAVVISLVIEDTSYDFLRMYVEQFLILLIVIANLPYPVKVVEESIRNIRKSKA